MSEKGRKYKFSQILRPVVGMLVAVIINLLSNKIAVGMGLPLYLDSIGTFLAAAMGGYLPGILVGYITNVVTMINNMENVYYASVGALLAVACTSFAKKGFFDKLWKSVLTIPCFAIIGGIGGSVLTYLMYGFGMGEGISAPFTRKLLEQGVFNVFTAQLTSDFVIDLIDKAICVFVLYSALKVIPDKIKRGFHLTGWQQRPFTKAELGISKRSVRRRFSLETKITAIVAFIMLLIAFVTTTICYLLYHSFAMDRYFESVRSASELVAATVKPEAERIDEFMEMSEDDPEYVAMETRLDSIRTYATDVKYIYVYKIDYEGCHVVFDLDTADTEGSSPGEIIPFDMSFRGYMSDLISGKPIEPIITDDTYGWLLTSYEPIYDSKGRCVCYAAADISVTDIKINEISFVTKAVALFAGFFILILATCMWLARYHLVYPVNAMSIAAEEFTVKSKDDRAESLDRLNNLDIKTGDEIEHLYDTLRTTMAETVEQMEHIKEKGDQISKMQNGLITVLADMVESRDKNTGDHVKKTSDYTRLLLESMKKKGVYKNEVTDQYIDDVSNSAALHDIGKIKVPDSIFK